LHCEFIVWRKHDADDKGKRSASLASAESDLHRILCAKRLWGQCRANLAQKTPFTEMTPAGRKRWLNQRHSACRNDISDLFQDRIVAISTSP
jgi:hypothetical protein